MKVYRQRVQLGKYIHEHEHFCTSRVLRECLRNPQKYFKLTSGDFDFDDRRLTRLGAA